MATVSDSITCAPHPIKMIVVFLLSGLSVRCACEQHGRYKDPCSYFRMCHLRNFSDGSSIASCITNNDNVEEQRPVGELCVLV